MVWSKENGYHQYGWWSKFTDSPICNVVTSPNMLLLVFLTNTNWVVNHTDCTRDHVVPDVLISVIRGGARSGSSTSMVTEWWGGLVVGVPLCLPHWVPMRSPTTPQHGPKISLTPGCAGEPQLTLWENTQIQIRIQIQIHNWYTTEVIRTFPTWSQTLPYTWLDLAKLSWLFGQMFSPAVHHVTKGGGALKSCQP